MMRIADEDLDELAPLGVAGIEHALPQHPGVAGVLVGITQNLRQDIEATRAAVESLASDIGAVVAQLPPTDARYNDVLRLQTEYTEFVVQFEQWYAEGDGFFNNVWSVTAQETLKGYKIQYTQYRQRFIDLGGKPTMGLPSKGFLDWLLSFGGGVIVGAIAIIGGLFYLAYRAEHER